MSQSSRKLTKGTQPQQPHWVWRPFYWMERKWFDPLKKWLTEWAIFDILDRLGKGVIVISLLMYALGYWDRQRDSRHAEQAAIYRARQVLADASGHSGDLGRSMALPFLIEKRQDLGKINLTDAVLTSVKLENGVFRDADFVRANLRGANLRRANLWWADLTDADLRDANLSGAQLNAAELGGALLSGAVVDSKNWINDQADLVSPPYGFVPDNWRVIEESRNGFKLFVIRDRSRERSINESG